MAFQSVPNTVEITFVYTQNNENLVNGVHAERAGGYNQGQLINLAVAMDAVAVSDLRPQMSIDATYVRVEIRGLDVENDLTAENSDGAGVGAIVGDGLPNNVTLSIKRASGLTGRSARGRWYWVGLAQSDLNPGENFVSPSASQDKADALDAVRAKIVTEGWVPAIVSRFTGGLERTQGVVFPWLTTVLVNAAVDSQRGRLSN